VSMSFERPVNAEAMAKIKEAFGAHAASDGKTLLFNNMTGFNSRQMTEIANAAGQPATVELHADGDIKVMADGTRYRVTKQGWQRLPAGEVA